MNEFQEKFIEEASELITGIEGELLTLESNPHDKDVIDAVFRVMHTLKGTASMFGFEKIEMITHQLETIYDQVRDDQIKLSEDIINITFETVDILKKILEYRGKLPDSDENKFNEVHQAIILLVGIEESEIVSTEQSGDQTSLPEKVSKYYYIYYHPDENIYRRGIKPFGIFYELSELGNFRAVPNLDKIPKPEKFDPDKFYLRWDIFFHTEVSHEEIESIFLFFNKKDFSIHPIDNLNLKESNFLSQYNSVGSKRLKEAELQAIIDEITLGEISNVERTDIVKPGDEVLEKKTALTDILKSSKELVKKISTLRVSADKLDHLIINVSEFVTLYAQIDLLAKTSENKQLSKSIQELGKLSKKLRDNALELRLVAINELTLKMHRLIRDLSKKLNKEIDFITEGTDTELDKTIIDNLEDPLMHIIRNCLDHGIEDKEIRIKQNKPEKGVVRLTAFYSGANVFIQIQDDGKGIDIELVKQKAVKKGLIHAETKLTDREYYNLLFEPGFSTAESVSKLSGRGVGMDVVKQKINKLRGEIEIDSELGLGTSVTIKLPLTLSIIDTLKVSIGNLIYLIPIATVETCLRTSYANILSSVKREFEYENTFLPLIMLREELDIIGEIPEEGRMVIIKQYEKRYCLMVDEVLGDHQAVVKPLGDLHKKHDYFSGASIMGDGSLALILDTNKILTLNKETQNHI